MGRPRLMKVSYEISRSDSPPEKKKKEKAPVRNKGRGEDTSDTDESIRMDNAMDRNRRRRVRRKRAKSLSITRTGENKKIITIKFARPLHRFRLTLRENDWGWCACAGWKSVAITSDGRHDAATKACVTRGDYSLLLRTEFAPSDKRIRYE